MSPGSSQRSDGRQQQAGRTGPHTAAERRPRHGDRSAPLHPVACSPTCGRNGEVFQCTVRVCACVRENMMQKTHTDKMNAVDHDDDRGLTCPWVPGSPCRPPEGIAPPLCVLTIPKQQLKRDVCNPLDRGVKHTARGPDWTLWLACFRICVKMTSKTLHNRCVAGNMFPIYYRQWPTSIFQ